MFPKSVPFTRQRRETRRS